MMAGPGPVESAVGDLEPVNEFPSGGAPAANGAPERTKPLRDALTGAPEGFFVRGAWRVPMATSVMR